MYNSIQTLVDIINEQRRAQLQEEKYVPEKDYGKRTKDWEFQDEEQDLISALEKKGFKISYQDKYAKGQRTRGPKNISKENIKIMIKALDQERPPYTIILWRG
jgi:hypothetical protein